MLLIELDRIYHTTDGNFLVQSCDKYNYRLFFGDDININKMNEVVISKTEIFNLIESIFKMKIGFF